MVRVLLGKQASHIQVAEFKSWCDSSERAANVHPGGPLGAAAVGGCLLPMRKNSVGFPHPDFSQAQPWVVWALRK